tara:strand:- start:280 stop:2343 length:2064 start_codon:yes stop_codon:yes gene_type:complete
LAFFDFFRKQNDGAISSTVPLVSDLSRIVYPEDNYENFASQGYGRNEIVHACIRELSSGVSNARWYVGTRDEGGVFELTDTPLATLIKYPNPEYDWYSWIERAVTYLQVSGNCYVYKERNQGNQVIALWLLRPDRVSIIPRDRGVSEYSYEIDGHQYKLDSTDVGHLALPNPSGDVYGLSPLHVLAKIINVDSLITDFSKTYFANAGVPSGLLKIKRRLTNSEEAGRIRSQWRSTFGGSNNMHQVAVLDSDADYQPMASAPADMGLTDIRNETESRICAVLGVPPILVSANVGLQRSTFSNYREARFSFHSETLEPLINMVVRFLNYCLAMEFPNDGEVMVDLSEMRSFLDDKDSITTRATTLFNSGIITLNEAREMVGQDIVETGEVRRIPINIIEDMSIDQPAPPEQLTSPSPQLKKANRQRGSIKLRNELLKDRAELVEELDRNLTRYFKRVQNRADGVLGRYMERGVTLESKAFPFDWGDLVPDAELGELSNILRASYVDVSRRTFGKINASGIAGVIEWTDKIPSVQRVLTQATAQATIIHGTTRNIVKQSVETALERGYSTEMLARGVPRDNFRGLRATLGETQARSKLIARTEVMRTQNQTSIGFFNEQGFDYLMATDPDGGENDNYVDPGDPYGRTCIERDGQVYHVEDAMNINDHPNGTLSWQPMDRNYQPDTEEALV